LVFLFTRDGRQANCVLFANLAKLPSLLPSKSISFPLSRSVSPLATCLATSCRCECGRRRCGAAQQQARLAGLSAVYHYAMRCNTCRAAQAPAIHHKTPPTHGSPMVHLECNIRSWALGCNSSFPPRGAAPPTLRRGLTTNPAWRVRRVRHLRAGPEA